VLLVGSIHFNIDPLVSASDIDIENTLRKVRLWNLVNGETELDSEIDTLHPSHGQRQLVSLARAMLRKTSSGAKY
jgi:ATP-binding cassette subfamily C (CFTR/MRP) protein 1